MPRKSKSPTGPVRPRIYFDADEDLQIAAKLEAIKCGFNSVTTYLQDLLRKNCQRSLEEAKKILAEKKRRE